MRRSVLLGMLLLVCTGTTSGVQAGEAVDFQARTLEGDTLRLSDFRGQVVVIDFWATWCPPCRKQLPVLAALEQQLDDVVVLAVCVDRRADKVEAFRERIDLPRRIVWDPEGILAEQFAVQAMPWSVLVDASGRIVWQRASVPEENADLVAEVRRAQAE